jgi:hypothetical protein
MVPLRPYLLGGCAAVALIAAAVVTCLSTVLVSETALDGTLRAVDTPPPDTLNIGSGAEAAPAASRRVPAPNTPPHAAPADAPGQQRRDPRVHTDGTGPSDALRGERVGAPGATQGGSAQQAPPAAGYGAVIGPVAESPPRLAKKPGGLPPGLAKKPGGLPPGLAKKPGGLPPGLAKRRGALPPGQAKKHG